MEYSTAMLTKTTRIVSIIIVFFVVSMTIVAPVNASSGSPQVPKAANPDFKPQTFESEHCDSFLGFKFCGKIKWANNKLQLCNRVSGTPYVCFTVVKNGCFDLSPIPRTNAQLCVRDYAKTAQNVSLTVKAKACVKPPFMSNQCKTFWDKKFTIPLR
jgi:hypothetical protein